MGQSEESLTEGYIFEEKEDEEDSEENKLTQEENLIPLFYLVSERKISKKSSEKSYNLLEEMLHLKFAYLPIPENYRMSEKRRE